MKQFLTTIVAIFVFYVSSQAQSNDKHSLFLPPLKSYFTIDRENIHLHLNKQIYITNETIWLKGYIVDKKNAKPFVPTTTVYVNLIDSDGKIVSTKTLYADNSLFEGHISLDDSFASGKYQLQAYTNFMNNFGEDESTVMPIIINNSADKSYTKYNAPNYSALTIATFTEGGVFLEGINNSIAVSVTDCNQNGIELTQGQVIAPSGEVISTFSTNTQGFGKFEIKNTKNGIYKVAFEIDNKKFEQNLPSPQLIGIAFTANNYAISDKMVLHIKTNDLTLKTIANEKQTFVIHQNDVVSIAEYTFKNGEKEALIPIASEYLSDGINTIRLINSKNQEIAQRNVFKPFAIKSNTAISFLSSKIDSVKFKGISPIAFASLSISVLPAETLSKSNSNIHGALHLNNYLKLPIANPNYYLSNFDRKKHFELDNALIASTSKYEWNSMLNNPPKKSFSFDSGFTIKGTVNSAIANMKKVSVIMSSPIYGINESAKLNANSEFEFTNIMAVDSTTLYFSLLDEKGRYNKLNMYTRVINSNGNFLRSQAPKIPTCTTGNIIITDINYPELHNAIELDAVEVDAINKKEKLVEKYKYRHNNNMSRGYKITDTEAGSFYDVLQWIGSHGYRTSVVAGKVSISTNYSKSFYGTTTPAVYIDDAPIIDYDLLANMRMATVDEIYINRNGYGTGSTGSNGTIRIYTKKGQSTPGGSIKVNSQSLVIKNGYQVGKSFKNPEYLSVRDQSFKQFGTIDWLSNVGTDENGAFTFSIPNLYQNNVLVQIEGITADGQMISEQIKVSIPQN